MTSADFTIADVLVWARTKPPRKRYDYVGDCNGLCALDYFLIETGRSAEPCVTPSSWHDGDGNWRDLPLGTDAAVARRPWTFGALTKRIAELVSA